MQTIIDKNIPLTMVRNSLNDIPEFPLTNQFFLRWFKPDDNQAWIDITTRADQYKDISLDLFSQEFGHAQDQLSQRMCFLCAPDGTAVGTAAAWFSEDSNFPSYPRSAIDVGAVDARHGIRWRICIRQVFHNAADTVHTVTRQGGAYCGYSGLTH